MSLNVKKTLTIIKKRDGFGAYYQAFMSAIAYCEYKGYEYVHTPILVLEHQPEMLAEMNQFIGIPDGRDVHPKVDLRLSYIQEVRESSNPDIYYTPAVLNKIREFYYTKDKPEPCPYDIAVHIRRGDVSEGVHGLRYTGNRDYVSILKYLKRKFPKYTICVYSEGKVEDFPELRLENVHFKLNGDIRESFHEMVTAKVLVISKSSFSYSAALLSRNQVYYLPLWHKPLSRWKTFYDRNSIGGNFRYHLSLKATGFNSRMVSYLKKRISSTKTRRMLFRYLNRLFRLIGC